MILIPMSLDPAPDWNKNCSGKSDKEYPASGLKSFVSSLKEICRRFKEELEKL